MKLVPLKKFDADKVAFVVVTALAAFSISTTKDLIRIAVQQAPPPATPGRSAGFDLEKVEAHARVLRALRLTDADATGLVLEDNDHKVLVAAVKACQFGTASEELAEVIADINDAKEPPAVPSAEAPQQ